MHEAKGHLNEPRNKTTISQRVETIPERPQEPNPKSRALSNHRAY